MNDPTALKHAILKLLPEQATAQFETLNPERGPSQSDSATDALTWVVVHYDPVRPDTVELPLAALPFAPAIRDFLAHRVAAVPWALSGNEAVFLCVEDSARKGRLVLFGMPFIVDLLQRLFPADHLTPAETRTMIQLLSGLSLKDAAVQDCVSYETKKTQLRSIFQKTHVNRQQDLSTLLVTHLMMAVAASGWSDPVRHPDDQVFFEYSERFLGRRVRASVFKEFRQRFRLLELGDLSGIPLVCVHHLGLFHFDAHDVSAMYDQTLRLICPLRHGALAPGDQPLSAEQSLEHALQGLKVAGSLVVGQGINLLALQSGCHYALEFAERCPEMVNRLIIVGASPAGRGDTAPGSVFMRALQTLALHHRMTLRAIVAFLNRWTDNPAQLKKVMQEVYKHGSADAQAIDALFDDPVQVDAIQYRLKHSLTSIEQDFRLRVSADWAVLHRVDQRIAIHFVHGDADQLMPIDRVSALIEQRDNTHLHKISGAGNCLFGRHTSRVLLTLHDIVSGRT